MESLFHVLFIFLVFPLRQVLSCLDDQCRELAFPSSLFFVGERLVDHTVATISVIDRDTCELRCYLEHNCVSINFKFRPSEPGTHNCELNNSTSKQHEKDLVKAANYVYHGTNNACGGSPCKNNAICQSGFTRKRYRCLCSSGFAGHDCEHDVDECTASISVCDVNANCNNTLGSYLCSCITGFTGDGKSCTACTAIGVADPNIIPDAQITATSNYLSYYPYNGRLNGGTGWCQSTTTMGNDYIQVDMGAVRTVCAVATQGKKNGSFIKSYNLSFSTDGTSWTAYQEQSVDKVFQANSDLNTILQHTLNNAVQARYVRFHPVTFSKYPCMRVEVFVQ